MVSVRAEHDAEFQTVSEDNQDILAKPENMKTVFSHFHLTKHVLFKCAGQKYIDAF